MFLIPKSDYKIRTLKKTGRGAFAARDIAAGTIIGDYLGTIIKSDSNDENKTGLYDMRGGLTYDIFADPKKDGIHLINHSCANNCDMYPYKGHILYFAVRKIFKGEEITVNYGLGEADEKDIVCKQHACHCGSKICTGSMHESNDNYEDWNDGWEKLLKREFGRWYTKTPGKYGTQLPRLAKYPAKIIIDEKSPYEYNMFGAEGKSPAIYNDSAVPSLNELRKRIRETGRRPSFPKLHVALYGIRDGILIGERI
jgi:hypothetical protein